MPLDSAAKAREALLYAIKIEHATIPPYLTALYSLKAGTNQQIHDLISGIVFQEMQHMALAANILNAIGGVPEIDRPEFIPTYPGGLPFHIGDRNGRKLDIHLQRFSIDLVTTVFMAIEEPNAPLTFPVHTELAAIAEQDFQTIGDFYSDLRSQLKPEWFTGDPKRQVSSSVDAVRSVEDARAAIDLIIAQGEGTTRSPEAPGGKELAHYYRFEEISKGLTLSRVDAPGSYAFAPPAIPFDATGVWPTVQDPSSTKYLNGTLVRAQSDLFNQIYSNLLRALQQTFNGTPDQLEAAIGLMFDLKIQAQKLMSIPLDDGNTASPCFEWVPA
jgi:rubrerythrin